MNQVRDSNSRQPYLILHTDTRVASNQSVTKSQSSSLLERSIKMAKFHIVSTTNLALSIPTYFTLSFAYSSSLWWFSSLAQRLFLPQKAMWHRDTSATKTTRRTGQRLGVARLWPTGTAPHSGTTRTARAGSSTCTPTVRRSPIFVRQTHVTNMLYHM